MSKALVLFSGGLDSILAAKILERQGIETLCIHFATPFFGLKNREDYWKKIYGLNVETIDIGLDFVKMLIAGPSQGYGKNLNPCVDCKILLFEKARQLLAEKNAQFLASGEVLGQRPMSQRRDTLHLIQNNSSAHNLLLRPLSALLLPPTLPEQQGIVDREKLLDIAGRGRNRQLELAREFGLEQIPSPAGGCALTEKEKCRRYWTLLKNAAMRKPENLLQDFYSIDTGRAFFHRATGNWMAIGKNCKDNEKICGLKTDQDVLIRVTGFAGPVALAREGKSWPAPLRRAACELVAAYSPAAVKSGNLVKVSWDAYNNPQNFSVMPTPGHPDWFLPAWEEVHSDLKAFRKAHLEKKRLRKMAKNSRLPALIMPVGYENFFEKK